MQCTVLWKSLKCGGAVTSSKPRCMQWNVEAHHGNCNTQMQESFDNAKSKSVILQLSHNTPSYFMVIKYNQYTPHQIKWHKWTSFCVKSHLASWTACWASTSRHHSQKTLLQTIAREQCSEQCTVHLTRNKSSVLEQTFSARLDPRLPRSFHSTRLGGALACRTSPNSFDARRRQKARVCTSSRWNLNIKTTVIFKMQASLWTAPHFTFVPQMLPTVYRKSVR